MHLDMETVSFSSKMLRDEPCGKEEHRGEMQHTRGGEPVSGVAGKKQLVPGGWLRTLGSRAAGPGLKCGTEGGQGPGSEGGCQTWRLRATKEPRPQATEGPGD